MLHTDGMSQRFKAVIQEALRRKGWSQNYFAERIMGVHPTALSQWWKTGKVSRENLRKIAGTLDEPIERLYAALSGDDPQMGDKGDELAETFAKFVENLPAEDREAVATLLTIASRKMASQFLLDSATVSRKDDNASSANPTLRSGGSDGIRTTGSHNPTDQRMSRMRGKK